MSLKYGLPLVFASVGTYFATTAFDDELPKEEGEIDTSIPSAPYTEAPSYQAPSIEAPSYQAPSYQAPSYQAPSYQAPSYQAPSYQAPSYQASSYQAPSYQAPSYQAPKVEAPSMFSSIFGTSTPSAEPTATSAPAPSMFSSLFGTSAPAHAPATGPSISDFPAVPTEAPIVTTPTPTGPTETAVTPTGPTETAVTPTGPTETAVTPTGHTETAVTPTGHTETAVTPTGPSSTSEFVPELDHTTEFRSISAWSDDECKDYLKQFNITDKSSFRHWLIRNHPDRGGDSQIFANVTDCVKRILPDISSPQPISEAVSTGLALTEQVPTETNVEPVDILEPITTPQADEVHGKECGAPAKVAVEISPVVQEEVDVLEPITVPQADEVHKKECKSESTLSELPPLRPTDTIVANLAIRPSDTNLAPMKQPVQNVSQPTQISIPRMGLLPSNQHQNSSHPLIYGEPQQGPVAETYDPSELYRRTRANLRKTGRGRQQFGRKTLKKRHIF